MLRIQRISIYPTKFASAVKFTHKSESNFDGDYNNYKDNYPKPVYIKKNIEEIKLIRQNNAKKFLNTPEGEKRWNLTFKEMIGEANTVANTVLKNLNIPQELHPKLLFTQDMPYRGFYDSDDNVIFTNPQFYVYGDDEFEHIIAHEAFHCQKHHMRSELPENDKKRIIQETMIDNILNGEQNFIPYSNINYMKNPNLPPRLRTDFADFAKKYLFTKDMKFVEKYFKLITDFQINEELDELLGVYEELKELTDDVKLQEKLLLYSISLVYRYNTYLNESRNDKKTEKSIFSQEEAETAMREYIETKEASYAPDIADPSDIDTYLYSFCPEEIKAETFSNNYLIEVIDKKLENKDMDKETQDYYINCRNKATKQLEYLAKGKIFYDTYKMHKQNPDDKKLKDQLSALENELKYLKYAINPEYFRIEII